MATIPLSQRIGMTADPMVNIQEVADYYFSTWNEWDFWKAGDFPNCAPPWEHAVFDYELPAPLGSVPRGVAVAVDLLAIDLARYTKEEAAELWGDCDPFLIDRLGGARWAYNVEVRQETGHNCFRSTKLGFMVDGDGALVPGHYSTPLLLLGIPSDGINFSTCTMLLPVWMALSFANCKNVKLAEAAPPARGLRRSFEREYKRPISRYYVLEIAPMRRMLESSGGTSLSDRKMALHRCRGHFKTYTADKPLMGKFTGSYFWHDHLRGHVDKGVVVKDYKITS